MIGSIIRVIDTLLVPHGAAHILKSLTNEFEWILFALHRHINVKSF